jgi:hypothetical protein
MSPWPTHTIALVVPIVPNRSGSVIAWIAFVVFIVEKYLVRKLRLRAGGFSDAAASGGDDRFSELVPNGQGMMMQLVPSAERHTLVADVVRILDHHSILDPPCPSCFLSQARSG